MFGQEAAACCAANANVSGGLPARLPVDSRLTIAGRSVAFPMVDPFGPVRKTGTPVTGLTAFPGRYNRLGRRYYGLSGGGAGLSGSSAKFRGLGAVEMIGEEGSGTPPWNDGPIYMPRPSNGSGGGIESILASIRGLLPSVPAILSAARGNPYYNPAQLQQQPVQTVLQQPVTQQRLTTGGAGSETGAVVGGLADSIGNIVTEHPLLTLAVVGGAVLLFMKPPSRR